jgi:hypothetical protein
MALVYSRIRDDEFRLPEWYDGVAWIETPYGLCRYRAPYAKDSVEPVFIHQAVRLSRMIRFPNYWELSVVVDYHTPEQERFDHYFNLIHILREMKAQKWWRDITVTISSTNVVPRLSSERHKEYEDLSLDFHWNALLRMLYQPEVTSSQRLRNITDRGESISLPLDYHGFLWDEHVRALEYLHTKFGISEPLIDLLSPRDRSFSKWMNGGGDYREVPYCDHLDEEESAYLAPILVLSMRDSYFSDLLYKALTSDNHRVFENCLMHPLLLLYPL